MTVNKNSGCDLLSKILAGDLTVDHDVPTHNLNSLSRQPDHAFDIRFGRFGGITKNHNLPPIGLTECERLLVDKQLVTVVSGNIRNINSMLSTVGAKRARPAGDDGIRVRIIVGIVGRSERKSDSASGTDDSLVISKQGGCHRPGRDHVPFSGERPEQQYRHEQRDKGFDQTSKRTSSILFEIRGFRVVPP